MEILLWLLPAATVTLVAMVGVGWWGRESRGRLPVDQEVAARKLGEALAREQRRRPSYQPPPRAPERSTGVALRAPRARPVVLPGEAEQQVVAEVTDATEPPVRDRRAS